MARFRNKLDHVRVAAPCTSDWDQMIGSERVRFCGQCSLNVYNLSSMTRSDAESLIAGTEGDYVSGSIAALMDRSSRRIVRLACGRSGAACRTSRRLLVRCCSGCLRGLGLKAFFRISRA
jgi:hypothetical protein